MRALNAMENFGCDMVFWTRSMILAGCADLELKSDRRSSTER
jgi:hypothetical protein